MAGQAVVVGAAFRVTRRFGVGVPASTASPASVAWLAAAAFADGLRVARGLVGALVADAADGSSPADAPDSTGSIVAAFDARVARRFGAAIASTGSAGSAAVVTSLGAEAARPRGARVLGFRAERGAAAAAASVSDTTGSVAAGSAGCAGNRRSGAIRGALGGGFWATCARRSASSSGGTSLHGSFELRGGMAVRSCRPYPRSTRTGSDARGRALTSG
jgi:hypothetical protein